MYQVIITVVLEINNDWNIFWNTLEIHYKISDAVNTTKTSDIKRVGTMGLSLVNARNLVMLNFQYSASVLLSHYFQFTKMRTVSDIGQNFPVLKARL